MPIVPPLESDLFGFIAGLPMHPLVVHAAVVLLPLSAVALIVLVFAPRLRKSFGWVTIAGLAVGTGAAFVAKESGEALAAKVGLPADHARWGDILVPVSIGLFVVAVVWLLLANRAARTSSRSLAVTLTGVLAAVLAVAATVITVIVGHSGAEAVWAGGFEDAPVPTSSATATAGATRSGSASPSASAGATRHAMTEVKQHSSATSCWSVVDGEVYNLTDWIDRHPGGAKRILAMCGTDGSSAFHSQHGNTGRAATILDGYAIGKLS
jgi:uncharacterized membrane protein